MIAQSNSPNSPPLPLVVPAGRQGVELRRIVPAGWHIRPQGPITLQTGEPEPDVAIARGDIDDWKLQHPGHNDVMLAVEVSDTSLAFDRDAKLRQYASTGISEYWIVNLIDRQIEIYREPQTSATGAQYRVREVVDASGTIDLTVDGKQTTPIRAKDLLP